MATRRAVKASSETTNSARPSGVRPQAARGEANGSGTKRSVGQAGVVQTTKVPTKGGAVMGPVAPAPQPMAGEGSNPEYNARFTPKIDRRIIEGMLHDRDTLMSEMNTLGISKSLVLRRAAELGLSEALIRQVKGVAADLAGERPGRKSPPTSLGARTCLCCDRVFLSTGPGNRLCMRCRGGDAGLAAL